MNKGRRDWELDGCRLKTERRSVDGVNQGIEHRDEGVGYLVKLVLAEEALKGDGGTEDVFRVRVRANTRVGVGVDFDGAADENASGFVGAAF